MTVCQKIAFASRAAANAYMRGDHEQRSTAKRASGGHAYRCQKCDAWHWTSMSKTEARRRGLR
jgi:hypothetical protein